MDKELCQILLLVLLLCHKGNTDSQDTCPYKCHCFTPAQVLCSERGFAYLPKNTSEKVKDFIMISSDLPYLFSHSLQDSPHLTRLVFLNNALHSVHVQAFDHLVELQELEISGNPLLNHLLPQTFAKQGNLTKLLLNFNKFKTMIPGIFDRLVQLETLQMKGNIISHLPTFLFLNLHNLKLLDLSQNKLEGVTREMFAGLAKLEILKLNNNLISNLTSDTFHNISQLTELYLEWNTISELTEDIFSVLTNLEVLSLRGNLLTTFSDNVFGFEASNLKVLNLKGNRLKELTSLRNLTSLSHLTLSSNWLSNLPEDIFRNVTTLEYLDLSENQLTSLPETIFKNLLGMIVIHLNKNNLTKLAANLFEDQVLMQQLYLSDNQLETLPEDFLEPFLTQHTVRLHGNPWKCDCHMWYLHEWVLGNYQDIEMLDRMLCQSPAFLRRRPVVSIEREQLVCPLSKDKLSDLGRCSQEVFNGTVTIRCKVDKCSPLTVKVQFEQDDGSKEEHILKSEPGNSQCGSETVIQTNSEDLPDY